MREFLTCADQDGFCLVVVKLKFVVCHPVLDVRVTVRRASQEGRDVVGGVTVLKLGIISIGVVSEGMGFDDCGQGRCVKSEENGAKDRSLRNTTG